MEPDPSAEPLFREEALAYLAQDEDVREPLRVSPPWTWSLLGGIAVITGIALLGAALGKVEVIATGRGKLQPLGGVRLLQTQVGGVISEVHAHNGDFIRRGQSIAGIHSAQLQGSLLEADRQLALLRSTGSSFHAQEDHLIEEQLLAIDGKIHNQGAQIESCRRTLEFERKKVANAVTLFKEKLIPAIEVDQARDQLDNALRQQEASEQQLQQLEQERAALGSSRHRQHWQDSQETHGAQTKRDALESALRQTQILAPTDGFLEALVVRPGDVVQAGQALAKVVSRDLPLRAVAFLPEKEQSHVRPGTQVRLALDAYPSPEYGTLQGRVVRVGSDLASAYEVREVLGEEARLEVPSLWVEMEVFPDRSRRLRSAALRPDMLLQARFTLRKQSILSLVLHPLRQWLD